MSEYVACDCDDCIGMMKSRAGWHSSVNMVQLHRPICAHVLADQRCSCGATGISRGSVITNGITMRAPVAEEE